MPRIPDSEPNKTIPKKIDLQAICIWPKSVLLHRSSCPAGASPFPLYGGSKWHICREGLPCFYLFLESVMFRMVKKIQWFKMEESPRDCSNDQSYGSSAMLWQRHQRHQKATPRKLEQIARSCSLELLPEVVFSGISWRKHSEKQLPLPRRYQTWHVSLTVCKNVSQTGASEQLLFWKTTFKFSLKFTCHPKLLSLSHPQSQGVSGVSNGNGSHTKALKANSAWWRKKNIAVSRRRQRMRNVMGQSSRKSMWKIREPGAYQKLARQKKWSSVPVPVNPPMELKCLESD